MRLRCRLGLCRQRKAICTQGTVLLAIITAGTILYNSLSTLQQDLTAVVSISNNKIIESSLKSKKLYFETDSSFGKRLELESSIQYAAKFKGLHKTAEYFNTRQGYNESYVDSLPLFRDVPDYSPAGCSNLTYPTSFTTVSVIFNYNNEVLSLLLRSIYTTLAAIPPQNLHELILVDDGSNFTTYPELRGVEDLVSQFSVKVRYYRFERNKGLIFSRAFGAKQATGDTLLIMDSHVEMRHGFLPPLLNITDNNYKAMAIPVFDFLTTIGPREHWPHDGHGLGYDVYLNWNSFYRFLEPRTKPFQIPGMLGGAFLITRRRLEEIDYFGKGLVGWGMENIELSIKNVMCGGEIFNVPCSRCIHFAAVRDPEIHDGRIRAAKTDNIATVAKSFLSSSEYAEFRAGRGDQVADSADEEAVQENKKLLKDLKCTRNYEWIRDNLMHPFVESFTGKSLIAAGLMQDGKCVVLGRTSLELNSCTKGPFVRQMRLSLELFELKWYIMLCLDFGYDPPRFMACHGERGNQVIRYSLKSKQIMDNARTMCLTKIADRTDLTFEKCDESNIFQRFTFKTVYHPELIP